MTRLIGRRCKRSDAFSRPVLIGRGLGDMPFRARYGALKGSGWPVTGSLLKKVPGDHSGGATPVPIPNTEVKPTSADGTWGATPWESRTSPG
jgi:hypothetical protein